MAHNAPAPTRTRQVLLGLFICWQLWFLFVSNLTEFVHNVREQVPEPWQEAVERLAPGWTKDEGRGHVHQANDWLQNSVRPWMQTTGQLQLWALFPGAYVDIAFPALEVSEDDPDRELDRFLLVWGRSHPLDAAALLPPTTVEKRRFLSPQEPADVTAYFRWKNMRLRRVENAVACALPAEPGESEEDRAAAWKRKIGKHLDDNGALVKGYVEVRLGELRAELQDKLPAQVVLMLRQYRTAPPSEGPPYWQGPQETPLVRWCWPHGPQERWERYDPARRAFEAWE